MNDVLQYLSEGVAAKLPALLLGIAVLLLGWIVATLLARLVGKAVHRLTQGAISQGLVAEREENRIQRVASTITYYVAMVFVVVQVCAILGLTAIRDPFLAVANELALAVPNLAKAVLTILAAWLVATVTRSAAMRLLRHERVLKALYGMKVLEPAKGEQWAATTANLAYYLVFAIFLPAILSALHLDGLRGPLEQLVTQAVTFLPRLIAAAVTLFVGYLIARVAQGVTTHFLASAGVDALPAKVGMDQLTGETTLSKALGTVAFVLLMLPLAISALDSLGIAAISAPAISMLTVVLNMIPNIVVAIVLVFAGIVLSRWVANLVSMLLEKTNVVRVISSWGILPAERVQSEVPGLVGKAVGGVTLLMILVEVFNVLRLAQISAILEAVLGYVPRAAVAIAVLIVGHVCGRFANKSLNVVLRNTDYPNWLASCAQYAILILAGTMALEQLGVAQSIVVNAFTIGFGSLGLATAIALGLGAKDVVQQWLEDRVKAAESKDTTAKGA